MKELVKKMKSIVVSLGFNLKFIIEKRFLFLKNKLKYNISSNNKIYWVNPQKLCYISKDRDNLWRNYLQISGGDWDETKMLFNNSNLYKAFEQRFNKGMKWEDTKHYQIILEHINKGTLKWNLDKEKWDDYLKKIDILYQEIKNNGYKSQKELHGKWKRLDVRKRLDEISVNIGRDGEFLVIHGKHRLAIAKLLHIPLVPIVIIKRHKKWIKFKQELSYLSRHDNLYQRLTHPDLQEFQFKYGDVRFELIKKHLSVHEGTFKGTLLDIGTNLGYFCHKMEDLGFDCYGIEKNMYYVYFLKKLRKAENKRFKIIQKSIFSYNKGKELKFDVVLALFIFHHFLKRKNTYLNLIKLLNRLKVKEMFFGAHDPKELQNTGSYVNYTPGEFVKFIIEKSCLKKYELIGILENGRHVYKLTI